MEKHEEFAEWAEAQGVKINGIAAHRFPGAGVGIVATTKLKEGSVILTVPTKALLTSTTVSPEVTKALGTSSITIHGLLAAELALDTGPNHSLWHAVMPTFQDFKTSMPLLWSSTLQSLLPAASQTLLANQKLKLSKDWAKVHAAFPRLEYDEYIYRWLLVNTRTFHYVSHARKAAKPTNPDDCMALNPIADYFNHTDEAGCDVTLGPTGYTLTTTAPCSPGEELFISYGSHSNDFLLTEYGFILPSNKWDEVSLDLFILPLLTKSQKETLEEAGFLGKYVLDNNEACHRTQVVMRLLCVSASKWQRFVDGLDDGEKDQAIVNRLLVKIITSYLEDVGKKTKLLNGLDDSEQRDTLIRRWDQIRLLLQKAKAKNAP